MVARLVIAVLAGSAVTFSLLFVMQGLIASGQSALTEVQSTRIVDFVRVKREETLERKRDRPDRPSQPNAPPPEAPSPSLDDMINGSAATSAVRVSQDAALELGGVDVNLTTGFGVSGDAVDGDYLPIVKVAPIYPQRAIEQGIEGWVIVEFTVTKAGTVRDPRVVEYHPSTVFNKAALAAALKFKYKPRVVNGEPIEVRGVLNRITFELVD
jgi:periplasmic protein TonB